ncbi:UDP-2,3-diacylglucosamine diphosphatase LpxI [uncultured Salipiger sp.]|mgnify:CR=1 FL=1|uniref:LpxI family protein n=1 Tax=uncultured Salipiger sp. TaxID=499810 RepID=UPI0025935E85|nr:UDP-2,3-diacylglucosamine diphosphatase LpxI [uncultured Salipiger sp.]
MLALIAGQGALPRAVAEASTERPLICALEPHAPEGLTVDRSFRVERLGGFLHWLRRKGVRRICMCGRVQRPELRLSRLDWRTVLMLPAMRRALKRGDDGALRIVISLLEEQGFEIVGAHEAAPSLLPPEGVPTRAQPDEAARTAALLGDRVSAEQGARDFGQACVIRGTEVLAREDDATGTDAMIDTLTGAEGGVLYKAEKPGQDTRVDLPVIGPRTARGAIRAGLAGIVVSAGGVMVLDRDEVLSLLDEAGLFLWVRERP